jgi:hypothetical protein
MLAIEAAIRALGGIATLRELVDRGHEARMVWLFADYGRRIVRVRKGVYATPDLPEAVLRACKVGGRLDCVSALEFHGVDARRDDGCTCVYLEVHPG